ncbi:MAG: hypothetical protein ACLURY_12025 [Alistipes putredinis]
MAKVRNLSDIQQEIAFTEFDFYQRYEESLQNIGTWTDQVTSSSSRDGDIVRFSRREAEEFESEARTKVLLHT